jgi:hypothetical protein
MILASIILISWFLISAIPFLWINHKNKHRH